MTNQTIAVTQRGILVTALANLREESLRIYPNPVSGTLHIEGVPLNSTIFLYDPVGRLLNQYRNAGATYWLATDALPGGVYYVHIQSDQKTTRRQIIKLTR